MPKEKRKTNPFRILIYGLFFFLFTLVFPKKIISPVYLMPRLDKSNERLETHPYILGGEIGFFQENGQILQKQPRKDFYSFSEKGFFNYSQEDSFPLFFTSQGEAITIETKAYPFVLGEHILAVGGGGTKLSYLNSTGEALWSRDFNSHVTVAKGVEDQILLGLADGRLFIFDQSGDVVFEFEPGGSRIPIILGADYCSETERIAVVSGVEPQRLIFLEKKKAQFRPVFHRDMTSDFRRETYVEFSQNRQWLFVEEEESLLVMNVLTQNLHSLPRLKVLHEAGYLSDWGLFYVASQEDSLVRLDFYTSNFASLGRVETQAEDFFFDQHGDVQFWGINNSLWRTELSDR